MKGWGNIIREVEGQTGVASETFICLLTRTLPGHLPGQAPLPLCYSLVLALEQLSILPETVE